jgi:ribulose-5-phosphate 4-epimerase/fuculose-1-phosphate aldolase
VLLRTAELGWREFESDRLKEFTRIENAVQNAADMIQQLKAVVQDHGPTRTDRSLESVLNRAEAAENFYAALSRFLLRR